MDVPNVRRTEFQLLDISDGFLCLMDGDGNGKDDVKVPDNEVGKEIETAFDDGKDILVTILASMGEEVAIS
jgi:translation initiation factor 5A